MSNHNQDQEPAETMPTSDTSTLPAAPKMSEQAMLYVAESGLVAPDLSPEQLANVPTFGDLLRDMGIPQHVATQDILNQDVVLMAWREQQAILVETGEVTNGFFVLAWLTESARYVTTYMGAMVLTRSLRAISPPVKTRITKRGRVLEFA